MIDTVWTYLRKNVGRNSRRIFATTHPYLSGIIALGLVSNKPQSNFSKLELSNISDLFLTYNTVAFGFSLTAIAICLSTASQKFINFVSQTAAFRDLLFVFSWNALVHFLCIMTIIGMMLFLGPTYILASDTTNLWKFFGLWFYVWLQIYSVFQFLVSFIAIYEFADLFAKFSSREANKEAKK